MQKDLKTSSGRPTSQGLRDTLAYHEKKISELKPLDLKPENEKPTFDRSNIVRLQGALAYHEDVISKLQVPDPIPRIKVKEHTKMEEAKLNFLLMGKTGQGKSATGNTMLNRRFFISSARSSSVTKDVDFSFAQCGRYVILMVDGPGLEDTDLSKAENTETAVRNMNQAVGMCYGGVDAFLFVTQSGSRFTKEDRSALETLKHIFGPTYLNHVIVVMTGGDTFQESMAEEKCFIDFHDWCKKQVGGLGQLYEDCKARFVLINNREKDETKNQAQVLEIIQIAHELQTHNGRYTSQCFKAAEASREKLILEHRAPQLIREIQEKISLLTADIEAYSEHESESAIENIRKRVHTLREEIEIQDKGFGVLQEMRELAQAVEERLEKKVEEKQEKKDVEEQIKEVEKKPFVNELETLSQKLEMTRTSKRIWSSVGSMCAFLSGGIGFAPAAPVPLDAGDAVAVDTVSYAASAKRVDD